MCANIAKFKQDLLQGKDKWADNPVTEETKAEETETRYYETRYEKARLKNFSKRPSKCNSSKVY